MDVAVVGLGKLGAPMAACLAHLGYKVHATDANESVRSMVARGVAPVREPGLQQMLGKHVTDGTLAVSATTYSAALAAEVIFVIVPTPSLPNGRFDTAYLRGAMAEVGRALKEHESAFPVVVVTSTVMPGDTNGPDVRGALESASGKRAGVDFGIAYSPEFIALGSVINDWLHPDQILLGSDDARTRDIVSDIYRPLGCPITMVSVSSAEMAKIAINTFITSKINFANAMAILCDRTPGADVDQVTLVMGMDSRIGHLYLKGGVPYGGPCFPRDNLALTHYAAKVGVPFTAAHAVDGMNRRHALWLAQMVARYAEDDQRIGVIGIAYKPGTPVTEVSPGLAIAKQLQTLEYDVTMWDPIAWTNECDVASSLEELLQSVDLVVITQPEEDIETVGAHLWRDKTVIDCWRKYDQLPVKKYVPVGRYVEED